MVRVRLEGVHKTRKRRPDGTVAEYFYAWKGGPRLPGAPGSPEFVAAYAAAQATRAEKPTDTFAALVDLFRASGEFARVAEKTRADYEAYLRLIERRFGDLPLVALEAPEIRGEFKAWRDSFLPKTRKADYAWAVLARILSVALDRGKIRVNPCARGGRLYAADRAEKIWTDDHLARLAAVASPEVMAVVTVALWTGQRQGDVLRLPWSALVDGRLRLRQSKRGARVEVPVAAELAALLAALPRRSPVILTSSEGTPWTGSGFRASFGRACTRAGIDDVTFHDIRGTAVTRLAQAGCTIPEIAAVTGHALDDVAAILDAHYLGDRSTLAGQAVAKLEEARSANKTPNQTPNRS